MRSATFKIRQIYASQLFTFVFYIALSILDDSLMRPTPQINPLDFTKTIKFM